jgi:hypothetical protein
MVETEIATGKIATDEGAGTRHCVRLFRIIDTLTSIRADGRR